MPKLVILDRDGVINQDSDEYIKSPDEWKPIEGSLEAIARLNQAEYRVVVITNQSGLARGLFMLDDLNQIHQKMHEQLAEVNGRIEAIFFCPHSNKENCNCRKPRTGLFQELANCLGIPLTNVPAVGDSLRDLQAASAVGAQPILVLTGKGRQTLRMKEELYNIPVYDNLAAFVDSFLTQKV
ncbi:MAG: D-glycero-beta-D-manno-heptose 1,7-bisphosphate 7-phosphatase [Thiomargarita sp.]|nr:D-glycero-beta-D-manno-heptose 1,7-bisphosphate 7-phosphatase [Thiomargarita sp.]